MASSSRKITASQLAMLVARAWEAGFTPDIPIDLNQLARSINLFFTTEAASVQTDQAGK